MKDKYFNEDGTPNPDKMHYCIYHQANLFDEVCGTCLVNCEGHNKRPFMAEREYMI